MESLKVGIIEDDFIIAQSLVEMLENLGYIVPPPASRYSEAIAMIEDERPDLLLVDIRLQGKLDGIDVAGVIKEKFHLPFIFLTANSDTGTVARAKNVSPAAFLAKPVTQSQLYAAIEIAVDAFRRKTEDHNTGATDSRATAAESLVVKDGMGFVKLRYSEIAYIVSEENYVKIYLTDQQSLLIRTTFTDFLQLLDTDRVLRVHRSYAVSLDKIDVFHNNELKIGSMVIPVSKTYRDVLMAKMKL